MKQLLNYALIGAIALGTATMFSCSDKVDAWQGDPEQTPNHITVTTSSEGDVRYFIAGEGEAAIDWGDGSEIQTVTLESLVPDDFGSFRFDNTKHPVPHTFPAGSGIKTVTITGDNVTGFFGRYSGAISDIDLTKMPTLVILDVNGEALTSIDITKNPKLRDLYVFENQITALDVSKNPELGWISVFTNKLPRQAFLDIFEAVSDRSGEEFTGQIFGGDNPGWAELTAEDKAVAENKGWDVYEL